MRILADTYIDMDFIKNRILELEKISGLSERRLSISLGYNPSYLKEIVAGRSKPSIDALLNICEYFKITPLEFFDSELVNPVLSKEIYTELKRLCNSDMKKFLNILRIMKPNHLDSFIEFMEAYKNINY